MVLERYKHIESIPENTSEWGMTPGRAARLAEALASRREEAFLYRKLAILREDVPLKENLEALEWQGAYAHLKDVCRSLGDERIPERVTRWR
jgi:5'-3' exonuclease